MNVVAGSTSETKNVVVVTLVMAASSSSRQSLSHCPTDLWSQGERLLVLSNTYEAAKKLHVGGPIKVAPMDVTKVGSSVRSRVIPQTGHEPLLRQLRQRHMFFSPQSSKRSAEMHRVIIPGSDL